MRSLDSFMGALGVYQRPNPVQTVPTPQPTTPATPAVPATPATPATPADPMAPLNSFANSAGMQFQIQQGANALQHNYAARGALQSGAAMKALQDYGQHTALQNYFMPYMGLLGGQQAVGAQAGSAIAGVGSNFGNTAANINGQMGGAIQNGADALSNAALVRGANTANMWGGVGSAIGNVASSYIGSQMPSSSAVQNPGPITVYANRY